MFRGAVLAAAIAAGAMLVQDQPDRMLGTSRAYDVDLSIPVTINYGGVPPYRFQGRTEAYTRFVYRDELHRICGVAPAPYTRFGCAWKNPIWGDTIVLLHPCLDALGDTLGRRLCHEIGHLQGWPAKHGP